MKRPIFYFLFTILLASCDPFYIAEIKNETDGDIFLQISFDRETLEESWNGRPYIPFLNSFPNWANIDKAIIVDTVNLIYTYKITSRNSFPLESGVGHNPDFSLFKSILVSKPDSLIFDDKQAIKNAFIKTDVRKWELKIN